MTSKNHYAISRHKFFANEERQALMRIAEARSIVDQAKRRTTWKISEPNR